MMDVKQVNDIFKKCEDELNVMIESKMMEMQEILLEQQVLKNLLDWKEEVNNYFASYHDEEEEESEFNRLLYESVELQLAYNDANFKLLMNNMAKEISKEINEIIQKYALILMNGESMSRKQFDQKIFRLGMLQNKADNRAVDMICYIANSTFEDIENNTLDTTRALIEFRGEIYWNKVLEAIEELESGSMDELEGVESKNNKCKAMNARDMIELAIENGFEFVRQTGSHRVYNKNGRVTIIPVHSSRDLGKGLAHKIKKQIKN